MRIELPDTSIGAFVHGCQLREVDEGAVTALKGLLRERMMICIRGQSLTPVGFRDAMTRLGTPMLPSDGNVHPEVRELNVISHEDRAKTGKVVGFHWHTDQSFRERPAALTTLFGVETPATGGDTQFANMYAAYDALRPDMKAELDQIRVVHRYRSTRKDTLARGLTAEQEEALPEVLHPIVRTHPETGRKALYLNRNRMDRIPDFGPDRSEALLDRLMAHATQERFTYRHKWQPGDVVIWDNRCTMHKANGDYPEGARRYIVRMMTQGERPV
ncbi:MAG: TauD/TfdA family dioxygenase [Proteobacteria bacterium]|nr:TauD/TfdA family dioxygenase [Pseudomonadota bacterium]